MLKLAEFRDWLTAQGAVIEPPTNEFEIIRVRSCFGLHVAYRNKKGRENWPEALSDLASDFKAGRGRRLSPDYKDRVKLRHTIAAIMDRDGCSCWFSGVIFSGPDDDRITIEHLCPISHGGPNHVSNLVLATEEMNRKAANLSVSEKVRMRETLLANKGGSPC